MRSVIDDTISATEANRKFSEVLRRVREGHTVTVTLHGDPVAEIVPRKDVRTAAERQRDHLAFLERLRTLPARNIGTWTRDELYDDTAEDFRRARGAARDRLLDYFEKRPGRTIQPWTRDELYEDEG